ncbi:RHS repeat domain-containing protein [Serratia fonticola]|uniref:RHS repeat domain-containing protein n=1 Tax=Serratia fonticola TaxID=47917 RepID=UPI00293F0113|nr:RHS repeat-associated core domain-containing protein [Serratia fonticola]
MVGEPSRYPQDKAPAIYWYQNDQLGTPHELTDGNGNSVWKGRFSAFGQEREEWLAEDAVDISQPLRFQGQYADKESGLYYNLNRYYDPGVGRYLTVDPVGLAGGSNQYQYCPNPIAWIDPLGLLAGLGEQPPKNTWNAFQQDHKGVFADSKESAAAYAKLKNEQSPWPYGYTPTERVMQPGERFNMALSSDQSILSPGGFGTFDDISNVSYVRNQLAVKDEWKPDVGKVSTYEVVKPINILEGPVGPQIDGKKYLPGGGTQLQMILSRGVDKMSYLKPIQTEVIK